MRKVVVACLLVSIFAMFGFLKFDRGVSGDKYYSESRPNIVLKIDPSLRYLGEIDHMQGRLKAHAYIWLAPDPSGPGMDKMFIVEHSTVSQELEKLTPSDLFRGLPHFAKGKLPIGGDSFQYVMYITEPKGKNFWTEYITKKGFLLNQPKLTGCFGRISTDTAWTKFYYMESYDPSKNFRGELTPEDKAKLNQFIQDFKHDVKYLGKHK